MKTVKEQAAEAAKKQAEKQSKCRHDWRYRASKLTLPREHGRFCRKCYKYERLSGGR